MSERYRRLELALADLRMRNGELAEALRSECSTHFLLHLPQDVVPRYSLLDSVLDAAFAVFERRPKSGAVVCDVTDLVHAVGRVESYYEDWLDRRALRSARAVAARGAVS